MSHNTIDSGMLTRMFLRGTHLLSVEKEAVNALNVYPVPDGDTGTNMSLTMAASVTEIQSKAFKTCAEVTKSVARGSLMGARGNSGVILSQIFRGFSKGCEGKTALTVPEFAHALKEASDMAYRAVLKPVEGTILSVVRETAEKAVLVAEEDMLFHHFLRLVVDHAEEALARTPESLAVLKQAGVVDAGGKGLVLILHGFEQELAGEHAMPPTVLPAESPAAAPVMAQPEHAEIHYAYCTEFIIQGQDLKAGDLRTKLEPLGDSLVYVDDGDLIKVHIHTNAPGQVLEHGLKVGELVKIKIENMREQHHSLVAERSETAAVAAAPQKEKPFGIIAVAAGEGLGRILRDLGADIVIEGGQTMNPSTEDILKGIEAVGAECVFILPNNSNIILAANQAKSLSDRRIIVIPSKTVPQGIAGLVNFNPDHTADENEDRILKAIASVDTLQITYSVRDTVMEGRQIQKDDTLGILNGEIVASGKERESVVLEALEASVREDAEILTLYYGEEVSPAEAEALTQRISERFGDLEVELYSGGQPVYSYLFSIE